MISINRIKEVVSRLGKEYQIGNAYLFGSYARGEATENSDIDLIIETGKIEDLMELSGFKYDLEQELGTNVDVLTMDGVKPRFYQLIKDDRILVYGA